MRWPDAMALAARGVLRRPGRALLTVLAVALASALLTALLTIARTAQTRVLDELAKGGPLAGIRVAAAEPVGGGLDNAGDRGPTTFESDTLVTGARRDIDDAALRKIADIPEVRSVVPVVATEMIVLPLGAHPPGRTAAAATLPETVVGVDLRRVAQLPVSLLAGRLPEPGALTEVAVTTAHLERVGVLKRDAKTVVGTELELGAPRFFSGTPNRVRGRWIRAEIVGVVAQEAASGEVLAPIEQTRLARAWTSAGVGGARRVGVDTSPYSALFVVAKGLDKVARARARITELGYANSAPETLIESVQRYVRVVQIVLSGIGAIALVIAALGIANALFAAVRERRREIGVLKAIGARDRDVLRVFLVEAGALGFAGGLLGAVGGFAIARAVGAVANGYLASQNLQGVQLQLPLVILAGGVAGSTLLALGAGAFPARRAARLPAREAVEA